MKHILTIVISLGLFLVDWVLHWARALVGWKDPARAVVLCYHSVPKEQRRAFAAQMDQLLRYANPISADTPGGLTPGAHYVCVTFDDGYQNVVENAVPELRQRGIPSTIFVASGALGRTPNWRDHSGGTDAAMHQPILTTDQLRSLLSPLVQIGSHTLSHPMLAQLSEREARAELAGSRVFLERIIGRKVNLLSFPYGSFDSNIITWCREEGYARVFNSIPHLAFVRGNEFVTGRIAVKPDNSKLEFHLKLSGAYRWLPLASHLKRFLRSYRTDFRHHDLASDDVSDGLNTTQ